MFIKSIGDISIPIKCIKAKILLQIFYYSGLSLEAGRQLNITAGSYGEDSKLLSF